MSEIKNLNVAFLKAKATFIATGKSGTNTHQKWDYAKLEDIYKAVESSLSENGIFIRHFCIPHDNGSEYLYTQLVHAQTGEYVQDIRIITSEKPGNQARGAAETYCKKYAVLSLCAIPTADDDGQEEEEYIEKNKSSKPVAPTDPNKSISEKQLALLKQRIGNNEEVRQALIAKYNLKSWSDLKMGQFNEVLNFIDNH